MQMEEAALPTPSLFFSPTNTNPITCSNPKFNNPRSISNSKRTPTTTSLPGSVELDVSVPVLTFCNERHTLEERNNKKKAVSNVVGSKPIPKTSGIWNKSDGVESLDLLKAKPSTVPCRKKQHAVSYEKRLSKEAQLQDFIKKQNTYYKEIDEFILSEEEVESVDELD